MARSYSPLPWKKNFQKLPPQAAAVLRDANMNAKFVVCSEKVVSGAAVNEQVYSHLDIHAIEDIPAEFEPFVPSSTVGRTSFRNATPVEEVQDSLPLISKTFSGWAPNRGGRGRHRVRYQRMVRPKKLVPPAMSYIAYKRLGEANPEGISMFFQIAVVLGVEDQDEILRCLNLLQENVGVAELRLVEKAEIEALQNLSLSVGWEILEKTKSDAHLERLYRRIGGKKSETKRRIQDRLRVLRDLKPARLFLTTRGLVGYVAADFGDKLTVFEHLEVDHAMFVAHGPAEEFIKLNRPALVEKLGNQVERLVHNKGWEDRLRRLVKDARNDPSPDKGG